MTLHEWTHVAVSYDGEMERHFISGVHVEEDSCPGGDLSATDTSRYWAGLKIGARSYCGSAPDCDQTGGTGRGHSQFRGDIDESMLYSEALDQAQIYAIYHRAFDATSGGEGITFIRAPSKVDLSRIPAGIVGFWPLDGNGNDESGNHLGGTPTKPDWVAGLRKIVILSRIACCPSR